MLLFNESWLQGHTFKAPIQQGPGEEPAEQPGSAVNNTTRGQD